ncbi:sugar ABC transporter ATP-binding protein [Paenibacillus sp. KQZ6P-2]|uniref:Sugar ABC transporter ATP-binding protein n=1 Tax=Paenibacillus mangrovi TaxID=2931978 RepID=A0A9X1WU27_9BACL|nr:sugar ABC transporter ATP-binding protein [Paenibacillus mangrovi]
MAKYLLEMTNIRKSYPGVQALKGASLFIKPGEIHCLMGENGAGKSTLIKLLAGADLLDDGEIVFDGVRANIRKPYDARKLGISFIFQELSVINMLTVEENMTLGNEYARFGVIGRKRNAEKTDQILKELHIKLNAHQLVRDLSVSQKQMMLISKALSERAKLIVMDEPTASLTDAESKELFKMMLALKEKGISFLLVSHRFEDIFTVGDRITVLRDGENTGVVQVSETDKGEIIKLMVGRELNETFPVSDKVIGEEVLKVEHVYAAELLKDVSFVLKQGQILGVSGLAGAGKTELARTLFGDNKIIKGEIFYKGKRVKPMNTPEEAIKLGIALLPEERRSQGIVGVMTVRENISLSSSQLISRWKVIQRKKDKELADKAISRYKIKTPSSEQQIQYLSGGNQQKAIFSKWINTDADVILLDEPTRGIDIGAKKEIYEIMNQLAKEGKAIMMFSSELPELLGMCDEIMVLREGRVVDILPKREATQEKIMELSVGGVTHEVQ